MKIWIGKLENLMSSLFSQKLVICCSFEDVLRRLAALALMHIHCDMWRTHLTVQHLLLSALNKFPMVQVLKCVKQLSQFFYNYYKRVLYQCLVIFNSQCFFKLWFRQRLLFKTCSIGLIFIHEWEHL